MPERTDHKALHTQITTSMDRLKVPGVAIGLLYEGEEHTAGFGVTNVNHPLPVTPDTLFQIGSTTKTITATATMRLVEQGLLDLDAPLRTYLPDLRLADADVAARVTLRHLFTHSSGWQGDYFDDTGDGDDALANIVTRMATLDQISPLGSIFNYNNAGYYVAGRVIEVVTGKTYEAAARELVLAPLEMDRSFFFARDVITDRVAVGHRAENGRPTVLREWSLARASNPGGGLISTAPDQLRYARFHLGEGTAPDGARLLTPDSMRLMQTAQLSVGAGTNAVGISWLLREVHGTPIVAHGGATNGQMSAFLMVPSAGFALTILTNAAEGTRLHREISGWTLRHYLGLADADPTPITLPVTDLAAYTGHYRSIARDIVLTVQGDSLQVQTVFTAGFPRKDSPLRPPTPPYRISFYGRDRIVVAEGPEQGTLGEFLRDADGRIAWLRLDLRVYRRQD
jgi:CubicO group peptidase (beta-lactamase class C family)